MSVIVVLKPRAMKCARCSWNKCGFDLKTTTTSGFPGMLLITQALEIWILDWGPSLPLCFQHIRMILGHPRVKEPLTYVEEWVGDGNKSFSRFLVCGWATKTSPLPPHPQPPCCQHHWGTLCPPKATSHQLHFSRRLFLGCQAPSCIPGATSWQLSFVTRFLRLC